MRSLFRIFLVTITPYDWWGRVRYFAVLPCREEYIIRFLFKILMALNMTSYDLLWTRAKDCALWQKSFLPTKLTISSIVRL